jgi:ABC-type antimicrobial peptide transport system permease subunit
MRIDITKLVLVRMSILLLFGIVAGVLVGYGLSALIARGIVSSVNEAAGSVNPYAMGGGNFIGQIVVSMLGGEVPKLELVKLLSPNWGLLGSRLGILAGITLVVGLIPALRASRISPVTAIRDSE